MGPRQVNKITLIKQINKKYFPEDTPTPCPTSNRILIDIDYLMLKLSPSGPETVRHTESLLILIREVTVPVGLALQLCSGCVLSTVNHTPKHCTAAVHVIPTQLFCSIKQSLIYTQEPLQHRFVL